MKESEVVQLKAEHVGERGDKGIIDRRGQLEEKSNWQLTASSCDS